MKDALPAQLHQGSGVDFVQSVCAGGTMCAVTWRLAFGSMGVAKVPSYDTNVFPCNGYVWYYVWYISLYSTCTIKTTM